MANKNLTLSKGIFVMEEDERKGKTAGHQQQQTRQLQHISWEELDKQKYFTIGPALMLGVRLLVFPPMLIRTRLQVQKGHSLYTGTMDAFRKIYRLDGARGLYKGFMTSNLTLISGQIYVSTLELTRARITGMSETMKSLIAGCTASFVGQTLTVPIDIISQRQMMAGQTAGCERKSALTVIKDVFHANGVRGFYKGYVASLLTYMPNSGIWWGSYYYASQVLCRICPDGTPDLLVQGLCGPIASVVAAFTTNPMDVVRTRLQVEGGAKDTIWTGLVTLYREEGLRGGYKGLTARLAHSIPAGFLLITTYEVIKKLSKKSEV